MEKEKEKRKNLVISQSVVAFKHQQISPLLLLLSHISIKVQPWNLLRSGSKMFLKTPALPSFRHYVFYLFPFNLMPVPHHHNMAAAIPGITEVTKILRDRRKRKLLQYEYLPMRKSLPKILQRPPLVSH